MGERGGGVSFAEIGEGRNMIGKEFEKIIELKSITNSLLFTLAVSVSTEDCIFICFPYVAP